MTDHKLNWERRFREMQARNLNHMHLLRRAARVGDYHTLEGADRLCAEDDIASAKLEVSDKQKAVEVD